MGRPDTIVVMAPNWLGDAVLALPAIGAVRHHRPGCRLVVAARPSVAGLFRLVPDVDAVIDLPGGGGRLGAAAWRADAEALASAHADQALLLPNSFRSAWTAKRAGIGERWGYAAGWRAPLLTRRVRRPRRLLHMADYYLALLSGLGWPAAGRPAAVVVPEAERARAGRMLEGLGARAGDVLVGLAPGAAGSRAKQWPPERFGQVARILRERRGALPVIVGTDADREAADRVRSVAAAIDLTGQTDLPLLLGVMTVLRACVTNDSGAMHLAAAAGTPVTAVFGPTRERETAPIGSGSATAPPHAILTGDAWCRPCMLRNCPFDHRCMTSVDAGRVASAVERQIDRATGGQDA